VWKSLQDFVVAGFGVQTSGAFFAQRGVFSLPVFFVCWCCSFSRNGRELELSVVEKAELAFEQVSSLCEGFCVCEGFAAQ